MNTKEAVGALAALAQETRLAIYRLLVEAGPNGLAAGMIAERLAVAPSSLSFHLAQLTHAALIHQRRMSRRLIYAADFSAMNGLVAYLTENCCGGESFAPACQPGKTLANRSRKQPA
ncbi:MAG TPA: helix-turn-helix domain-containing protein [Stellaceae bacterium]|jgi:DNA-binding transcriptional ArsR family regulator|nr:helix-turn-helix domain-containing protein [Stellaceae bacterium]